MIKINGCYFEEKFEAIVPKECEEKILNLNGITVWWIEYLN